MVASRSDGPRWVTASAEQVRRLGEYSAALEAGDWGALETLKQDANLLAVSLIVAARVSSVDLARRLIELGAQADVDVEGEPHVTAVAVAIRAGNAAMVRLLVASGGLDRRRERELALHRAAKRDAPDVVQAILETGVPVDATDVAGETPLVHACRAGATGTMEVLIAAGADVNQRNGMDGRTPLMAAAAKGNPQVVAILLAAGADPKREDHVGDTAIATARRRGHTEVERLLSARQ